LPGIEKRQGPKTGGFVMIDKETMSKYFTTYEIDSSPNELNLSLFVGKLIKNHIWFEVIPGIYDEYSFIVHVLKDDDAMQKAFDRLIEKFEYSKKEIVL
jgi:hypothetical protein